MSDAAQAGWTKVEEHPNSAWTRVEEPKPAGLSKFGQAFWEGSGGQAVWDMLQGARRDTGPEADAARKKAWDTFTGIIQNTVDEPYRVVDELHNAYKAF